MTSRPAGRQGPSSRPQRGNEGAYEVVRIPMTWGWASILAFAGAYLVASSADWSRGMLRVWGELSILLIPGLIFGILGRRRDRRSFPALAGRLLNGGALLTFVVSMTAYVLVRYGVV
ncbi:MAG: hypothetical protein AAGN66_05185 [Acidobacteriota bacterium]